MKKPVSVSPIKLISIYYVNNAPSLVLQSIAQELKERYYCKVSFFDSNFFFLQIDWGNSTVFSKMDLRALKNNIILSDFDTRKLFIIPAAVILNGAIISFSYFINLITSKDFDLYNEVVNNSITPCSIFNSLEIFLYHPVEESWLLNINNFNL